MDISSTPPAQRKTPDPMPGSSASGSPDSLKNRIDSRTLPVGNSSLDQIPLSSRSVDCTSATPETHEEITRKAMQFTLSESQTIDSPELFRYLLKRKMAEFSKLLKCTNSSILNKTLTPDLIEPGISISLSYIPAQHITRGFAIACVEDEPNDFWTASEKFNDPDFFL